MAEQFRIAVFGRGRGPWRDSKAEAMDDARSLELASYDRSRREWFLAVPVELQRRGEREHSLPARTDREGQAWSPDDLDQMRRLAGNGEPAWMIAKRIGRSARAIGDKARQAGIQLPREKRARRG